MSTSLSVTGREGLSFWAFMALLVAAHFFLRLSMGYGHPAPDFVAVAVLLGGRRVSGGVGALLGFCLGVLKDAVAMWGFGATAVVLTAVGFLSSRSRDLFMGETFVFAWGYLFLGKWIIDVLYMLLAGDVLPVKPTTWLFVQAPISALVTASAGTVALVVYQRVTGQR